MNNGDMEYFRHHEEELPEDGPYSVPYVFVFQDGVGLWNNGALIMVPTHIRHMSLQQYSLRFGAGRLLLSQADALATALLFPLIFTELWGTAGTVTAFLCSWLCAALCYSLICNPHYLLSLLHDNCLALMSHDREISVLYQGRPPLNIYFKVRCSIMLMNFAEWFFIYFMTFYTVLTVNGVMSVFWGNILRVSIRNSFFYSFFMVSFLRWMYANLQRVELCQEAVMLYSIIMTVLTQIMFNLGSNAEQEKEYYPLVNIIMSIGSISVLIIRFLAVINDAAEEYLAHNFGDQVHAFLEYIPENWHYHTTMAIMFSYRIWNHFLHLKTFILARLRFE